MAARGELYGLTNPVRDELLAMPEEERPTFLGDTLYSRAGFDADRYVLSLDKAWDPLHRCLGEFPPATRYFYKDNWSDGGSWARPEDYGSYPLKLAILGGRRLYARDREYFIRLIERPEVSDLAESLDKIDRADFVRRFWYHCRGTWPELEDEVGLEYTWEYFVLLRDFYKAMAEEGRCVVFLADQ